MLLRNLGKLSSVAGRIAPRAAFGTVVPPPIGLKHIKDLTQLGYTEEYN